MAKCDRIRVAPSDGCHQDSPVCSVTTEIESVVEFSGADKINYCNSKHKCLALA